MSLPSTHASLFVALQRDAAGPDTWEVLHARYHDVILTWCRRRGLSYASAEDLTQEIWLKLLHEIHRFDHAKGRFRAWLKAVVNNALTDFWRRHQRSPERSGVGGTAFLDRVANVVRPEAADELSGVLARQGTISAVEVLARVRARLHESTWLAFYRTLIEQRPAKEVAQELGLSVAAVYKHTYRVKQMLHEECHVHLSASRPVLSESIGPAAVLE